MDIRRHLRKKRKLEEVDDISDIENNPQDKRTRLLETDEDLSSDSEKVSVSEESYTSAQPEGRYPLTEISVKKRVHDVLQTCDTEIGFEPIAIGFESLSPGEIFSRHVNLPGLIENTAEVESNKMKSDSMENLICIPSTSSCNDQRGEYSRFRFGKVGVNPDQFPQSDSDGSDDFPDNLASSPMEYITKLKSCNGLPSSEDDSDDSLGSPGSEALVCKQNKFTATQIQVPSSAITQSTPERPLFGVFSSIDVNCFSKKTVICPLPKLEWSNEEQLWAFLNRKDIDSSNGRDHKYFFRHPSIQKRMRSVLVEWLLEVCSVYKLQRETYYLSIDYLDRYLTRTHDISKKQLQLIGVTCLLIAAKVEEIYPPKVTEFAYITDGACSESDILNTEHDIMNVLDWKTVSFTSNSWLILMYQLISSKDDLNKLTWKKELLAAFKLLDLYSLHDAYLIYSYKTIATAILCLLGYREQSLKVSGLSWNQISKCVCRMKVFYSVLENEDNSVDVDTETSDCSWNTICTHQIDINMVDKVEIKLQEIKKKGCNSVLTPPCSSNKKETK